MVKGEINETGSGNNEAAGSDYPRPLQLLRSEWKLPCDTELLEVSEVFHIPDAEPPGPKGKAEISEVSTNLELLHFRAAFDNGYLELETEGFLKSHMRENRTYGSVRGSDIPSRLINERSVELSTRVKYMELRLLQYFLAVAREESITKAAEVLHVTQPTLSRQMMELEAELGTTLFQRTNRKTVLTEDGLRLRQRAEEIVELVNKTKSEFLIEHGRISGDIFIGGGETDAMRLIAKTAHQLHKKYPDIYYHLYSGNALDVMEKLDKGLLDFGVLIEPVDKGKYEYLRLPAVDTWGGLMREDSPYAALPGITAEILRDMPLIYSRQSMVNGDFTDWLGQELKELRLIGSYNLVYNASLMVAEGLGCALCLDKLVNVETSGLCFRPLQPKMEAKLVLVWKKQQLFSPAAEVFLNTLRQAIQ